MLHKFFGIRPLKHPSRRQVPPKQPVPVPDVADEGSSPLKIVHVGGVVEYHYMAIPAARIIEKYPSCVLARPDIFRRPWDSVVRPEEILTPGQKFFIVPRQTVKKLRRRIRKPNGENHPAANSFVSQPSSTDASAELVSKKKDDKFSSKSVNQQNDVSTSIKTKPKAKARSRRVSFLGVDANHNSDSNSMSSISMEKKGNVEDNRKKNLNSEEEEDDKEKSSNQESGEGKRKVRPTVTWQPALTVIKESHGPDE